MKPSWTRLQRTEFSPRMTAYLRVSGIETRSTSTGFTFNPKARIQSLVSVPSEYYLHLFTIKIQYFPSSVQSMSANPACFLHASEKNTATSTCNGLRCEVNHVNLSGCDRGNDDQQVVPWGALFGSVSKPCTPGEHQNSW